MRRGILGKLWPSIGALTIAIAALPPAAMADAEIGSPGSGPGEIANSRGVAVDQAADLLYVTDAGNNRVDVFDADSGAFVRAFGWGVLDGTAAAQVCTATCSKGISGSGAGQFKGMQGIAVDNDPASPGYRSVYVFDGGNNRIQRFDPSGAFVYAVGDGVNQTTGGDVCTAASGHICRAGTGGNAAGQINQVLSGGIAVGPGGTIYVVDRVGSGAAGKTRVQKFTSSGSAAGELLLEVAGGSGGQTGVAVDTDGSIYITTSGETGALRKYDAGGIELLRRAPSFNVNAVAVGATGRLFVGNSEHAQGHPRFGIHLFDSAGGQIRTLYSQFNNRVVGIVEYQTPAGDLFSAEEIGSTSTSGVRQVSPPPPGPLPLERDDMPWPSTVGNTKATLDALVNPEGKSTTFHFEYITDEAFLAAGETFGAGTLKTPESALPGLFTFAAAELCRDELQQSPFTKPDGCELRTAQAAVVGLSPETVYHFRVVASNADGSDRFGSAATFETKQPIEFGDLWATGVGTAAATLHAELNPLGIPANARFEYVPLDEYESSGFANAEQAPAPPADALDLGEGEEMEEVSVDLAGLASGTSYRYRVVATNQCKPAPAPLCDFAEREGTFRTFAPQAPQLGCPNDQQRAEGSGTFLPDCRAYEMVSPPEKLSSSSEALYNNLNFSAGLDQAALDGEAITYSAYKAFGDAEASPFTSQYLARRDAANGWVSESISPVRQGPSLMTYEASQLDRQYKAFSADLCSGWLIQDANPTLAPEATAGYPGLYRRGSCADGLHGYEALSAPEIPGTEPPNLAPRKFIPEPQGMSSDGAVAIFSVADNLTSDASPQPVACIEEANPSEERCESRLYEVGGGHIRYVCILPNGNPHPGSCSAGQPGVQVDPWKGRSNTLFHAISADGSRIFWTASRGGPGPLYVRIGHSETVRISPSSAARFWGASADGSKVVFSIDEQLFESEVEAGQAESPATLIAEGVKGLAGFSDDLSHGYLVSTNVLTGEEANDVGVKAAAGQPNLYLYRAGAGFRFIGTLLASDIQGYGTAIQQVPAARLSRVSPNGKQLVFMAAASLTGYDNKDAQSGSRVMEVYLYDAAANGGAGALACVSCNPSGGRPQGRQIQLKFLEERRAAAYISAYQSHLYGQRVLSGDGESLFFNSFESLASRDTNGQKDVYQWRSVGSGGCSELSTTYSEVTRGCVDLISSGRSPQGSELVDISADGKDVFFKTNESLDGQDPGELDIYDARIGGGFSRPPVTPPICEGESCQAASPPPPALAPSSRVAGPGNPRWRPKKACPKGKHKVKRKGKVRCLPNKKSAKNGKGKNRDGRVRGAGR